MLRVSKRCRLLVSLLLLCGCLASFSSGNVFAATVSYFPGDTSSASYVIDGGLQVEYRVSSEYPYTEYQDLSSIQASSAYAWFDGFVNDYFSVTITNSNAYPVTNNKGFFELWATVDYTSDLPNGLAVSRTPSIKLGDMNNCFVGIIGSTTEYTSASCLTIKPNDNYLIDGKFVLMPHESYTFSFSATRCNTFNTTGTMTAPIPQYITSINNFLNQAEATVGQINYAPTTKYILSNFPISPNSGSSSSMSSSNLGQRTVNIVSSTDGTQYGNFQYSYTPFVPSVRDSYLVPNFDSNGNISQYYYESIIDYTTILDLNIVNWTNNDILINRQSTATGSGLLRFGNFTFASPSSNFSVQSFTVSDVTPTNQYFTAAIESNGIAISPPVDYIYRDRIFLPNRTSVLGNIKVTFTVKVRYNESIYDPSIRPDSSVLSPMLNLEFGGFDFLYSPLEAEIVSDLVVNDSDRLDSLGDDINNQTQQQQQQHEEQMEQSQQQYDDFTSPGESNEISDLTGSVETEVSEKIGIFTFLDNSLSNLLSAIDSDNLTGDSSLTLPEISVPIDNVKYTILEPTEFDLGGMLNTNFPDLMTVVRFATSSVMIGLLFLYLFKVYHAIFGGHI